MTAFQHDLPRVTYTSAGGDLEPLHRMLDAELPRFRAALGKKWPNRIAGAKSWDGTPYTVVSPLDSALTLGTYVEADGRSVARAVEAARAAWNDWSRRSPRDRVKVMRRFADMLDRKKYELAMAVLYEVGKTRMEALGETEEAVALVTYYCDQMEKNGGFVEAANPAAAGETAQTLLRPIGVFGVISPFNYPVALSVNMISAALVAGNTVVWKPTPAGGLSAGLLADVFETADLPVGVFNMICGAAAGPALVDHPDISGIAFTGSHQVGMEILRKMATGAYMRPVLAEMGGKNAAYVSKSADVSAAAEGVARSAFGMQGQKCSACSVAFVHESVYDAFMEGLVQRAKSLRIGNTERRDTTSGPLINSAALDRYERAVAHGAKAGRVATGGRRLTGDIYDRGFYVEAAVIEGLPTDDWLFQEEQFAPVLAVTPFRDLTEALTRGNRARYGLTAGFYGADKTDIETFTDNVDAGVLYINRRTGATTGAWPGIQSFCGWKGSGLTGKGGLGPHYLPQFMREQSRTIRAT